MPWQPKDAAKFTRKASTPKLRRQWSHISNDALRRGASDASAIRQASSVVARAEGKGERLMARKSTTRKSSRGRGRR